MARYKYRFRGASNREPTKEHQIEREDLQPRSGTQERKDKRDVVAGCAQGDDKGPTVGTRSTKEEKREEQEKKREEQENKREEQENQREKEAKNFINVIKYFINPWFLGTAFLLLLASMTHAMPTTAPTYYPNAYQRRNQRGSRPFLHNLPAVTPESALLTLTHTPVWDPAFHEENLSSDKYFTYTDTIDGNEFKVTVYILFRTEPIPCLHHLKTMKGHFDTLEWDYTDNDHQLLINNLLKKSLRGPALESYNHAFEIVSARARANAPPPPDPDNPPDVVINLLEVIEEFKKNCHIDQRSALRQKNYMEATGKPGHLSWQNFVTFFNFQERYRIGMLGTEEERSPFSPERRIELLRAAAPKSWMERLDHKFPDRTVMTEQDILLLYGDIQRQEDTQKNPPRRMLPQQPFPSRRDRRQIQFQQRLQGRGNYQRPYAPTPRYAPYRGTSFRPPGTPFRTPLRQQQTPYRPTPGRQAGGRGNFGRGPGRGTPRGYQTPRRQQQTPGRGPYMPRQLFEQQHHPEAQFEQQYDEQYEQYDEHQYQQDDYAAYQADESNDQEPPSQEEQAYQQQYANEESYAHDEYHDAQENFEQTYDDEETINQEYYSQEYDDDRRYEQYYADEENFFGTEEEGYHQEEIEEEDFFGDVGPEPPSEPPDLWEMTPSTLQDRYEAGELPPFSIHPSVQAFAPEYYLDDYFVPPPIAAYLASDTFDFGVPSNYYDSDNEDSSYESLPSIISNAPSVASYPDSPSPDNTFRIAMQNQPGPRIIHDCNSLSSTPTISPVTFANLQASLKNLGFSLLKDPPEASSSQDSSSKNNENSEAKSPRNASPSRKSSVKQTQKSNAKTPRNPPPSPKASFKNHFQQPTSEQVNDDDRKPAATTQPNVLHQNPTPSPPPFQGPIPPNHVASSGNQYGTTVPTMERRRRIVEAQTYINIDWQHEHIENAINPNRKVLSVLGFIPIIFSEGPSTPIPFRPTDLIPPTRPPVSPTSFNNPFALRTDDGDKEFNYTPSVLLDLHNFTNRTNDDYTFSPPPESCKHNELTYYKQDDNDDDHQHSIHECYMTDGMSEQARDQREERRARHNDDNQRSIRRRTRRVSHRQEN